MGGVGQTAREGEPSLPPAQVTTSLPSPHPWAATASILSSLSLLKVGESVLGEVLEAS